MLDRENDVQHLKIMFKFLEKLHSVILAYFDLIYEV
jgi:hypothetical protein